MLLQALEAEELGANRIFRLRRAVDDDVGGLHFEPPFRDTEGAFPIPGPGSFGASGLNRLQVAYRTLAHLPATAVSWGWAEAPQLLALLMECGSLYSLQEPWGGVILAPGARRSGPGGLQRTPVPQPPPDFLTCRGLPCSLPQPCEVSQRKPSSRRPC